jgi:hypothetical protein
MAIHHTIFVEALATEQLSARLRIYPVMLARTWVRKLPKNDPRKDRFGSSAPVCTSVGGFPVQRDLSRFTSCVALGHQLRPLRWCQIATDQVFVTDQAATMLGNDPYGKGRYGRMLDRSSKRFFDSELATTAALSAVELARAATIIAMMSIDE